MSRAIIRSGVDAYVLSAYPNANYAAANRLRADSGEAESFVFFKNPAPKGSDITSATLRFRNAVALTGSVKISAQRVGASWKARRLTWNNKPGVVGSAADSATIVDPTTSTWFEVDVTSQLQTLTNGSANYGWKITTTFTTLVRLFSLNAELYKPHLVVEWTDRPDTPGMLVPYGGQAVAVAKPVVRFSYSDPGGDDALDAVNVQIDAAGNFTSGIDFDSGWVTSTVPELDLSTTAYAGLADGSSTSWRARVRDEAGGVSNWSDPATFSRDDKGTLTITNPAASPSNFVDEFTPPISWTFTGETQKAYRILIAKASRPKTWIYDSGRITSTSTSHTLPRMQDGRRVLHDDTDYIVRVRVWDTKDRSGITYAEASRQFTMTYDATVDPATSLTATQAAFNGPAVQLDFQRATMPDEWVIIRDGIVIDKIDVAADLFVSGTSYRYTDRTARPLVAHTYKVKAVVNHKTASANPTVAITTTVKGVWLEAENGGQRVHFYGTGVGGVAYGEDSAVHIPLGATKATRIVAGMRGLEGAIAGVLRDTADGRSWDDHKQDLLEIKASPSTVYRLTFGDENIPVVVGLVNMSPAETTQSNHVAVAASFSFWQAGELPFDAEI